MTRLDFGLAFASAAERLTGEAVARKALVDREIRFHVGFLDDALGGILPNDLIVLGARTGVGKTALASLIAQQTALTGKRVHYFALEAEPLEIERRLKYRELVSAFYSLGGRSEGARSRLNYRDWYRGQLEDLLGPLNKSVEARIASQYQTLTTYYRGGEFNVGDLDRLFLAIQDQTDLIVLDHLHYVDTDEPNENRAYKAIVKRIRDISLSIGVPIILVAHLRKRDRASKSIAPDLDEFHGTSDVPKIATKCVMLSPAYDFQAQDGKWPTLITVPKDRMDGSTRNFAALVYFSSRTNRYDDSYGLARLMPGGERLEQLAERPHWAKTAHMLRVDGVTK